MVKLKTKSRRDLETQNLLENEEMIIAKVRAKLKRKEKKKLRKVKDLERLKKGNMLLKSCNETAANESLRIRKATDNSSQKTVVFKKDLTNIITISPKKKSTKEHLLGESANASHSLETVNFKLGGYVLHDVPQNSSESLDTYLPTKTTERKRNFKQKRPNEEPVLKKNSFDDVKMNVSTLLSSNVLTNCEFSLPKDFTALKLEKIREKRILQKSYENISDVKADLQDGLQNSSVSDETCKFDKIIYQTCDNFYSVIVSINKEYLCVWMMSSKNGERSWSIIGSFGLNVEFVNPFLFLTKDRVAIKSFYLEDAYLKEITFTVYGEDGTFSDSVTSTQSILVLKESMTIDKIVSEKYDANRVVLFHELGPYSRGSIVTYTDSQIDEVAFLGTIKSSVISLKTLKGETNGNTLIVLVNSELQLWNIEQGVCLQAIKLNKSSLNRFEIFDAIAVRGIIHIVSLHNSEVLISVLKLTELKPLASYNVCFPKHTPSKEINILASKSKNLNIIIGNCLLFWRRNFKDFKIKELNKLEDFYDVTSIS